MQHSHPSQENEDSNHSTYFDNNHDEDELFMVRSAGYWLTQASKKATPRMLFGKLCYEGELCILFADSNVGKSILAVQIGNCINTAISHEPFSIEAEKQTVLYCDFELTDKQFEARYSDNFADHYPFNRNFYRAELNPEADMPPGFKDHDDYLNACLERCIIQSGTRVVIIDNLTYLRAENEQAKEVLPLMKHLKALKSKHNLSILVLAHTPKRDVSLPISRNDLQGSKMLMNFCDSAFTIGESQADKSLRYIKQIKQRNTEQVYGDDNVCLCQITKPTNFLQFEFVGYGNEYEHLRKGKDDEGESDQLKKDAHALRQQGLSFREIGKALHVTYSKADRLVKAAEKDLANRSLARETL